MTDTLEVTQEDREAAADHLAKHGGSNMELTIDMARRGSNDTHPLVQAFARHRIAAITAARPLIMGEAAGIAEAHRYGGELDYLDTCSLRKEHRAHIATAIRAAGEIK